MNIGKYRTIVTRKGLSLTTSFDVVPYNCIEMDAAKALVLLQLLHAHRDLLLAGVLPDFDPVTQQLPCPGCSLAVQLGPAEQGPGWWGYCVECGNEFTVSIAGKVEKP